MKTAEEFRSRTASTIRYERKLNMKKHSIKIQDVCDSHESDKTDLDDAIHPQMD